MSPKIAAAIRHLSARDKTLGKVARTIDFHITTPASGWLTQQRPVTLWPDRRRAHVRSSWAKGKVETLAYSIGWAAHVVQCRPDRALRKQGAFADRDAKRLADLAANVAIRRRLDKAFGYRGGRRPFEPQPFEEYAQRSITGTLGTECCDESACVYRAMKGLIKALQAP